MVQQKNNQVATNRQVECPREISYITVSPKSPIQYGWYIQKWHALRVDETYIQGEEVPKKEVVCWKKPTDVCRGDRQCKATAESCVRSIVRRRSVLLVLVMILFRIVHGMQVLVHVERRR